MSRPAAYTFVCPDCGTSLEVDRAMRDALAANGCVVCAVDVDAAAFTRARAPRTH